MMEVKDAKSRTELASGPSLAAPGQEGTEQPALPEILAVLPVAELNLFPRLVIPLMIFNQSLAAVVHPKLDAGALPDRAQETAHIVRQVPGAFITPM